MRLLSVWVVLSLCLFVPQLAFCEKAVVILSLDGVGAEQLKKIDPAFADNKNVRAILPPTPCITSTGHATIATGVSGATHGVLKPFWQIEDRPETLKHKPIWTEAAERGYRVKTNVWPFSYGPWQGVNHHADRKYREKFKKIPVDDILRDVYTELNNWKGDKPFLYMSYTPGLDRLGHDTGPYSEETKSAWKEIKFEIAVFQTRIEQMLTSDQKDIQIIYVSDHGMLEVKDGDQPKGEHFGDPSRDPELNASIWGYPKFGPKDEVPEKLEGIKDWALGMLKKSETKRSPSSKPGKKTSVLSPRST